MKHTDWGKPRREGPKRPDHTLLYIVIAIGYGIAGIWFAVRNWS